MAWTQTDIDTLKSAIGKGVARVAFADRTVKYKSIREQLTALALLKEQFMPRKIELGSVARDPITNFEGIVVSRLESLMGSVRISIQPTTLNNERPIDEVWFDETRIILVRGPIKEE